MWTCAARGGSQRVDPSTLTIQVFAQDVDRLARALGFDEFSLFGHSFGAIVSLSHALERGTAGHYVISSGAASSEALMADVEREIERFEPAAMRDQIKRSWDAEPTVATAAEARELMESQMPFHFWEMGDAYRTFVEKDETVYAPEVLAHFASERLRRLRVGRPPALDLEADAGDHRPLRPHLHGRPLARRSTPRWPGRELVVIEKAAHMTHVEQPQAFMAAIRALVHRAGRDRPGRHRGAAGLTAGGRLAGRRVRTATGTSRPAPLPSAGRTRAG